MGVKYLAQLDINTLCKDAKAIVRLKLVVVLK